MGLFSLWKKKGKKGKEAKNRKPQKLQHKEENESVYSDDSDIKCGDYEYPIDANDDMEGFSVIHHETGGNGNRQSGASEIQTTDEAHHVSQTVGTALSGRRQETFVEPRQVTENQRNEEDCVIPHNNDEGVLHKRIDKENTDTQEMLTRDLVKMFLTGIWNNAELDLIPKVCSPRIRFNGNDGLTKVGHEGFAAMVTTIRGYLSEYHCGIHSMVVEGNKAFCRLRFTGRHTGNLLGYEPTGRNVAWMGATEFTIKDGKILKVWELCDLKTLEEQLRPAEEQPVE